MSYDSVSEPTEPLSRFFLTLPVLLVLFSHLYICNADRVTDNQSTGCCKKYFNKSFIKTKRKWHINLN